MKTSTARLAALGYIVAALTACAVQREFVPSGGSRADGTIKMSADFEPYEVPNFDERQTQTVAKQRCLAWGYSGAEAFGGTTKTCVNSSSGSCWLWRVSVEYQCTGAPPAPR
jgi:hypothetical protein